MEMTAVRIPLISKRHPGLFATIDAADRERVAVHRWIPVLTKGKFYVATHVGNRRIYLHRYLTGASKEFDVDHWNGDPLDNRRKNLRVCPHQRNQQNVIRSMRSASGYRGVVRTRDGKWKAQIKTNGRNVYLGRYATPEEAAIARDNAAREIFGEYARLNFPRDGEMAA